MMINTYQSHMSSVAKLHPYAACYFIEFCKLCDPSKNLFILVIKITYTPISCAKIIHWELALSIIHP